jgi:hypothetical protein
LIASEKLDGVAGFGMQASAARVEMRQDHRNHSRIPEFLDVIGDARRDLARP